MSQEYFALDREELAWAAGFFDGEGTVTFRRNGKDPYRAVHVSIPQVNPRTLFRFQRAVRVGKVYGPYETAWQPRYIFATAKFEHAQHVVGVLWKFLSGPKREQARAALEKYAAHMGVAA